MEIKMNNLKKSGLPSIDKPWLKHYPEGISEIPLPKGTIYEYIFERNKDHLDDMAIEYMDRRISYREMFCYIDQTASAFCDLGVKKGDIVVIALPNIPENIFCIYALNKIGAVADMVDLRSKEDMLAYYFNEVNAKVAVICDLFSDSVMNIVKETAVENIIIASLLDSAYTEPRKEIELPECAMTWKRFIESGNMFDIQTIGKAEDIACIFHTSGTTGVPKGVMLSNRSFNAMAIQVVKSGLRFDYGKKTLNQIPPFLAYSCFTSMHLPFVQHMQMVLLSEYEPQKFAENIVRTKAFCCVAGPADWGNFIENKELMNQDVDLSGLVGAISGGDAMPLKVKNAVNGLLREKGSEARVLEGYGMTEIGSAACANMPHFNVDASVGIPLPFNNFCIYDTENDCELSYRESGEICMTGPTLMKGYYKNESETRNVLKKHSDGLTWLHSGDLGYIDENGCVYIEGRIKRVIVRYDGKKISPFALEKVIMSHENVDSCCVVGTFDRSYGRGQVPAAFFVLKDKSKNSLDEIRQLCEVKMEADYLPLLYRVIDSLPLTENGKVDFRKLEAVADSDNI